jgi:2-oxoglutarate dehydrogenase E2 component (dihydrolipoamide succinyltransferase)
VFGTLITAPIINQPQVAIMSTDGVKKKPVVIESEQGDSIAIRPVGVLAQTFDHRALDGAYSAAFLREVKTVLETRDWVQALNA